MSTDLVQRPNFLNIDFRMQVKDTVRDRRTHKHGVISPAVQSRRPQTQYWVYHHHHYHHLGISSALVTVYEQRCITAVHKNIKSKSQSH